MVWLPIMSVVVSLLLTHWKYHSLAVGVRDTAISKPSIYSDTICWMNISCWLLESSWRSYVVIVIYPMIIFVILHAAISLTYCPGLLGSRANRIFSDETQPHNDHRLDHRPHSPILRDFLIRIDTTFLFHLQMFWSFHSTHDTHHKDDITMHNFLLLNNHSTCIRMITWLVVYGFSATDQWWQANDVRRNSGLDWANQGRN